MSRDVVTSNTESETGSLSAAAGAAGRGWANSAAEPIIDRARVSGRSTRTGSGRVVMAVESSQLRWRGGGARGLAMDNRAHVRRTRRSIAVGGGVRETSNWWCYFGTTLGM